ncbi:MAG: hypothetical protein QM710_06265 [Flavobacterium sp.]
MENKKDIGKAINDKLASLDKAPREQVWSGISYELQKKKKRRIGFFLFWGKITAVLLIGAMAGLFIYYQNGDFNLEGKDKESNDSIIINEMNGKTYNVDPNGTKTKGKNTKDQTNTGITAESENNANNKSGVHSRKDGNVENGIGNNTNEKNNIGNKAGISNSYDLLNKNGLNGSNGKPAKGSTGKSLTHPKGDKFSAKSAAKGNSNIYSGKTSKGKLRLLSKYKNSKVGKKSAKPAQDNSRNTATELALLQGNTDKNNMKDTNLDVLQGKSQDDKAAGEKIKKTDSTAAKKVKDKTVTINMYPEDSLKTDPEEKFRKFYVDAFVSPTMYGTFAKGSAVDRDLDSLPKKSEIRFSYGFGVTYDLSEKLSIRIGYQKINISYITQDAYFSGNENQIQNFSGIDYLPGVSNQTVYNGSNFEPGGVAKMDVTQKISYTEIPLEVKYKFLDRKIALKSSFGFSYLLLNQNKVSVVTNRGYSFDIGKTKNMSATSVSVNLGLEAEYTLFKNTTVFMEPRFNYQVKAYSNTNFKPYLLGIQTGIRYSINNK